jgi:hypothetical protein
VRQPIPRSLTHFDAFSRRYSGYVKEKLGDGLAAARLRCGGRLRIEPDGEAFIRSICKLTHVGPKQYAKGDVSPPPIPPGHHPSSKLPTFRGWNTISRFLLRAFPLSCEPVCWEGRTKQTVALSIPCPYPFSYPNPTAYRIPFPSLTLQARLVLRSVLLPYV